MASKAVGQLGVLVGLILVSGCGPRRLPYPQALDSPRPEERATAIKHAAEIGDRDVIPLIIDRLEDDDEGVRFFAILALERLTGTRLGYDYSAAPGERRRAVERWRQYRGEGQVGLEPAEGEPAS